jgi:hypothetical protein
LENQPEPWRPGIVVLACGGGLVGYVGKGLRSDIVFPRSVSINRIFGLLIAVANSREHLEILVETDQILYKPTNAFDGRGGQGVLIHIGNVASGRDKPVVKIFTTS